MLKRDELCARVGGLILAAAALGTTLGVHAAGEPGWYLGGGGSLSALEDSDNISRTPGTTTPGTTTCGTSIPTPIPGLGVICIDQNTTGATTTPGSTQKSQFTFDDGWGAQLFFGYAYEGGFRPELSLGYSTNDIKELKFVSGFGTPNPPPLKFDNATITGLRIMANGWYDFDIGRVLPYFGGGVGMQRTEIDLGDGASNDDTNLAFQLGGGVGFLVTDYSTVSVDYRYLTVDDPTFDGDTGKLKSEYTGHSIGASYRYSLGTGGGRDSDGDGVPDRKDKCPNTPQGVQVYADGCPIDLDQDGVPDYLDKCPNTPPGSPVDANGCPFDSDGDGIPDHLDQCPGTPAGVKVDGKGCPLDSDGDGIPDYLDQCPETKPGTAVNAQGCEISDKDGDGIPDHLDKCPDSDPKIKVGPDGCPLDSDGDGIPDYLDECPNTPPGLKVLPNGCALVGDCRKPRPGEAVDAKGCALDQRFILRGVKFEFDSDKLTKPAELILVDVADTLAAYPDVTVEVQGHTDSLGTDAYNLGLSERRANAVKRFLSGRGVKPDRLRPAGYGESAPIADNATPEGQEENRRVEFKVVE